MKIKLSKLKPNPDNPRTIDKEKLNTLKESLKKYEQILSVKPLLIDSWENPLILGGNMRYRAMIEMGFTEIDEKYIRSCEHLTDEEKRALIVIDNANYGEFDYDLLSSFYDIDELELFGVDIPQFAEIDTDTGIEQTDEKTITLRYNESDYRLVKNQLNAIDPITENAILKLIGVNKDGTI